MYGNEFKGAQEKFLVPRESTWPPRDKIQSKRIMIIKIIAMIMIMMMMIMMTIIMTLFALR